MSAMFEPLQRKIADVKAQITVIGNLVAELGPECFDDEDRRIVQEKVSQLTETQNEWQADLDRKQNIYETQIRGLESDLAARREVLQKIDESKQCFRDFPDLLQFFVQKQKRLQKNLLQIKKTCM